MTPREKRILKANEKWISRNLDERQHKYKKNGRLFTKSFNGKSPHMILEDDEIKWKRFTKFG
jgi:hypothetical protein